MGQSKRGEDEIGDTDSSPVPEGSLDDEERAADPARCDELSSFPRERKSAGILDLAVSQDEPTQLIRYLKLAVQEHLGFTEHEAEWKALLSHFIRAEAEVQKMQDPSHKPVKHGSL